MRDEKLIKRIRENAAELERLRYRVSPEFRNSDQAVREKVDWERAYREWYESYDVLAFPGGLRTGFERLRRGELAAIDLAIQFLTADHWYIRSGYHKEEICRILKKQVLTAEQASDLRILILDHIRAKTAGRLMRAYAHLASKVGNPEFESQLATIAEQSNRFAAEKAEYVLATIRSQTQSQRKLNRLRSLHPGSAPATLKGGHPNHRYS